MARSRGETLWEPECSPAQRSILNVLRTHSAPISLTQLVKELRRGGGSAEMTRRELYHLVRRGLIRAPAPGMWTYQITDAGRTALQRDATAPDKA
jgi:hypothetical protein